MGSGGRAGEIARWFGVSSLAERRAARPPREVVRSAVPRGGEACLITGGSGSGKSTALRAVVAASRARAVWIGEVDRAARVFELFEGGGVAEMVSRLGRVGLAEAGVMVRRAGTLSEGERFRLSLALAIREAEKSGGNVLLACDEFTSCLDEASAMGAAATLARALRGQDRVSAVVATWREELAVTLRPAVTAQCDYGAWEVAREAG